MSIRGNLISRKPVDEVSEVVISRVVAWLPDGSGGGGGPAKPGKASTDANLMSGPPFCNDPRHGLFSARRNDVLSIIIAPWDCLFFSTVQRRLRKNADPCKPPLLLGPEYQDRDPYDTVDDLNPALP